MTRTALPRQRLAAWAKSRQWAERHGLRIAVPKADDFRSNLSAVACLQRDPISYRHVAGQAGYVCRQPGEPCDPTLHRQGGKLTKPRASRRTAGSYTGLCMFHNTGLVSIMSIRPSAGSTCSANLMRLAQKEAEKDE
jgi:hypothetical protein